MACGSFKLVADKKTGDLWVLVDGKPDGGAYTVAHSVELFGFGSGDWVCKAEARDVQGDCSESGRWLPFLIKDGNQRVILEVDRRLPEHVRKADLFNRVQTSITAFVLLLG